MKYRGRDPEAGWPRSNGVDDVGGTVSLVARTFHYAFAHWAVPWLVSRHPVFFMMLAHEKQSWADTALEQLCDYAKTASAPAEPSFTPADVGVTRTHAGRYPCVVLTLPRPTASAEAFMVALVQIRQPGEPVTDDTELLNFTVELVAGDPPRAAFCEWEKDKTNHHNYGHGPIPDLDEFVAWMAEQVDGLPTSRGGET